MIIFAFTLQGILTEEDKQHYHVMGSGGNYDLIIKNTELTDGGFYGCGLDTEATAPKGDVVVLGTYQIVFNVTLAYSDDY